MVTRTYISRQVISYNPSSRLENKAKAAVICHISFSHNSQFTVLCQIFACIIAYMQNSERKRLLMQRKVGLPKSKTFKVKANTNT